MNDENAGYANLANFPNQPEKNHLLYNMFSRGRESTPLIK